MKLRGIELSVGAMGVPSTLANRQAPYSPSQRRRRVSGRPRAIALLLVPGRRSDESGLGSVTETLWTSMGCFPPKPSDKMLRLFTSCGPVGTANKIKSALNGAHPLGVMR